MSLPLSILKGSAQMAVVAHFLLETRFCLKPIWLVTLRFCFLAMRLRFSSLALFSALIQLVLGWLALSTSIVVVSECLEKGRLASVSVDQLASLVAAADAATTAAALAVTVRIGSET